MLDFPTDAVTVVVVFIAELTNNTFWPTATALTIIFANICQMIVNAGLKSPSTHSSQFSMLCYTMLDYVRLCNSMNSIYWACVGNFSQINIEFPWKWKRDFPCIFYEFPLKVTAFFSILIYRMFSAFNHMIVSMITLTVIN